MTVCGTSSSDSSDNVETFQYRVHARIISVFHLALSTAFFVFLAILFAITIYVTTKLVARSQNGNEYGNETTTESFVIFSAFPPQAKVNSSNVLYYLWFVLLLSLVLDTFHFLSAVKLFKASKYGADPIRALRQARFWRNVNIVLLVLDIIYGITTYHWMFLILSVVSALVCLHFVRRYIHELNDAAEIALALQKVTEVVNGENAS